MNKRMPVEEYKKILENMPFCCVDIVICQNNKVLLIKRKNDPEKNSWWVPGGRIYKNEKLEQAAIRKVKEETGLDIKTIKKIGVYEYFSDKSFFSDLKTGTHNIVVVFLAEPIDNKNIKIDKTSSDFKWIDKIEEHLNPYVKQLLKDSQVFDL